ncbi:unnamed protein product [Cuscuta europaea]|uniref:Calmodulin-binding domain-containing protein n=1 Tax=Cuscuta europaea TaxID=41803 RepID=A0A9P1EF44_CUSEU|nr:unnamed protein product [Cuscuta europaea]
MAGESITLSKREVFKKKEKQRSKTRRFPRVIGSNKPSSSKPRQSLLKSRFCCGYTDPSSSSGCSTPDEQGLVQQMPDFIMASSPSSCHDINTYNVQGKVLGETNPVDCLDSRSVNQENKTNKMKNFRSTKSFRRKGRSRIMKQTKPLLDETETTSESSATDIVEAQGKEGISKESHHISGSTSFEASFHSHENKGLSDHKSLEILMRTSSLRKPSFRCSKVKIADKPTCSSTIRNSKFPRNPSLKLGKSESDILQVYKVCPYHHCSLHGHIQDSSTSSKRRGMVRKSTKLKKNLKQLTETNMDGNPDSEASNKSLLPPDSQKDKQMSMWNLIRRHMSSSLAAESKNVEISGLRADSFGEETATLDQDEKVLAVKLVREAIERILLPEVSDIAPDQEPVEKNYHSEGSADIKKVENYNAPSGSEEMNTIATDNYEGQHTEGSKEKVPNISNRKAPKQWSNLKKWILLQRFTKELERVRRLNKRKSRNLQVEPGLEAEKVHLRHQTVEEKKRAEEWMLDYALQQAMRELAPTQKRKVELLVKAFETMVPLEGVQSIQLAFPKLESNGEADDAICKAQNLNKEASTESVPTQSVQQLQELHGGYPNNDARGKAQMGNQNYIAMWHMVSQHVLSGIASNTKSALLDETDDESEGSITLGEAKSRLPCDEENHDLDSSCQKRSFNRDDAIKLVREAVNEILITQIQDDTFDANSDQTHMSSGEKISEENELVAKGKESGTDNLIENEEIREPSLAKKEEVVEAKPELQKSNKWGKLKKLLILKRSIVALENARKIKFQEPLHLSLMPNPEPERVDLRHQIMNERKKAQQWMLDYAVQHIVTSLTPARKRRVAMLVEAFEAVVPFPDNLSK